MNELNIIFHIMINLIFFSYSKNNNKNLKKSDSLRAREMLLLQKYYSCLIMVSYRLHIGI